MRPIYLDYNATTPVADAVLQAMLPYLRQVFGNPSSQHALGTPAREAVVDARAEVARLLGASPAEIVFTSGGTEATNFALKGLALVALRDPRSARQIVVSAIEHPATLEVAASLERFGFTVARLPVDRQGIVQLQALERALETPTLVVSLMHANNETGTLQPIEAAARLAHRFGARVHIDAAQSAGKVPVDVDALGADLLTLAGHKLYAPKGIGALYVRTGVEIEPLIHGAGQEQGRRAGTENVPYIVGLGTACKIARELQPAFAARVSVLRDRLWQGLERALGEGVVRNGHASLTLPNTVNASFVGLVGAELLAAVPEIAASTGSACHDGRVSISPVLAAMGVEPHVASGAVRFSLGRDTTEQDVDAAIDCIAARARRMREALHR